VIFCPIQHFRRAIFTLEHAFCANKAWTKKVMIVNTARPMSPASCPQKWFVLVGLMLCISKSALGQTNLVPQEGEISIGGEIAGDQLRPSAAFGASGGFAAWDDNAGDPSGLGVRAIRLNASLSPSGDPFLINETLGGDQQHPAVTMLDNGGAVFVWESRNRGVHNVMGRFVDSSGAFTTGEFLVNRPAYSGINRYVTNLTLIRNNKVRVRPQHVREVVTSRQEYNLDPGVVKLTDGSVVVVYSSSRKLAMKTIGLSEQTRWDNRREIIITNRTRVPLNVSIDYMQDVFFQRFSASGNPVGDETVANTARDYNQRNGTVAALANGGFVVCWITEVPSFLSERVDTRNSRRGSGRTDVMARRFAADGVPAGPEFRVNTINWPCASPVVAGRADGGFTVAWVQREGGTVDGADIWFRSYGAGGAASGEPARANAQVYGDQFAPSIATLGSRQILVWSSMGQDGSWEGVYGTQIENGARVDDEFRVNTTRFLRQINPFVATSGGRAMVLWSSYEYENGFDVLAQRYQAPQ
jgi:hypothetical protein